jgi:hypothetical protein
MSAVEQAHLLGLLMPHARAHALQLLARCPGLTVTSTLRSPERNRLVGGVPSSWHLNGRAADFTGSHDHVAAAAWLAPSLRVGRGCTGPEEVLVHNAGSGVHLHVAW